ncbi:MAG: anaerobic sulfatase-maturation protein [Prevotellaceae bacterium]|nr:anaerobic sulfatase-maturation protein [Prevotellaceae bacterium]
MTAGTARPFAAPLYVTVKPAGAACNLRCGYCYYLDKKSLYPARKQYDMNCDTLEEFTRQYLRSQTVDEAVFAWHGGEPLLRDIAFYRKALEFQRIYGRGMKIANSIQTNGTMLTDEWCRFFRENDFLVGISIDGPERLHDVYRRSSGDRPTFARVLHGIELLKKHGVEYNAMGVVHSFNVDYPLEFYRFFKETDSRFIQFAPVVETLPSGELTPQSVHPEKWGDFLIAVFDEWVRKDVGQFFVQYFDSALANWVGASPGVCIFAETCGHAGAAEFNGDVYSCDHFVFPEYRLGNLHKQTLVEMMYSDAQLSFGAAKRDGLPRCCRSCKYLFACRGECPKNRIATTPDGESGLNYLCAGYRRFFEHIAPYMNFMKASLIMNYKL